MKGTHCGRPEIGLATKSTDDERGEQRLDLIHVHLLVVALLDWLWLPTHRISWNANSTTSPFERIRAYSCVARAGSMVLALPRRPLNKLI